MQEIAIDMQHIDFKVGIMSSKVPDKINNAYGFILRRYWLDEFLMSQVYI